MNGAVKQCDENGSNEKKPEYNFGGDTLADSREWLRCCYVFRQSVPDTRSSNRESPVGYRVLWHQQTIDASRA